MQPIRLPRLEGMISRQAHADIPPGTYEREHGREGFFGAVTHFLHRNPPTAWTKFEGKSLPRLFNFGDFRASTETPWNALLIAHNEHLRFRIWNTARAMDHLVRNADGDELLFVHAGNAALYCDYGHIELVTGDYFLLPRGTAWRLEPKEPITLLLLEATNDSFTVPERGLVGPNAIFDLAALDTPRIDDAFHAQQSQDREWSVVFKKRGELNYMTYPFNPLDAVGWHGDLVPLRLNWRDIRPLMSHRYHVPPSAHTTFVTQRAAVCTFVPRPIESDPGALKVPFFHSNDDYDEIGFLHSGRFFSRDNVGPGMMTFHPAGFPHGPHAKAFEAGERHELKETHEVLINIDTRDPLQLGPELKPYEVPSHVDSWKSWLPKLGNGEGAK